jgi:biotin carboxyl carrier protein
MSYIIVEHQGARRRVAVAQTPRGVWVGFAGGSVLLGARGFEAERRVADGTVRAPMTGTVVELRARVGQVVAVDEVLVIVEAMKMEYRLVAPHAGEVRQVACQQGDLVDLGAALVTIGEGPAS